MTEERTYTIEVTSEHLFWLVSAIRNARISTVNDLAADPSPSQRDELRYRLDRYDEVAETLDPAQAQDAYHRGYASGSARAKRGQDADADIVSGKLCGAQFRQGYLAGFKDVRLGTLAQQVKDLEALA